MGVYNGEIFLHEAILSVLNQTLDDFEFIIVDDGSTDQTPSIIRSYIDERIKYFYQDHKGLPAALNLAIQKSKGNFIARMDADDVSLPNRLDIQLKYMNKHPDVDILGGQAYLIDECLQWLMQNNRLASQAWIYIECSSSQPLPSLPAGLDIYRLKSFGQVQSALLRYQGGIQQTEKP